MNIIPFVIAALFLVQFSMYGQSTGQVTLSIRLYPIQIIEVEPANIQAFEVSNRGVNDTSFSSPISTFSTSHFCLKVDTVKHNPVQVSQTYNAVPPRQSLSTSNRLNGEREDKNWENEFHIVYSMETL